MKSSDWAGTFESMGRISRPSKRKVLKEAM